MISVAWKVLQVKENHAQALWSCTPVMPSLPAAAVRQKIENLNSQHLEVSKLLAPNLWLMQISFVIHTIREVMTGGTYSAIPELSIQIQQQYWHDPPSFALTIITWIYEF